jgi:hypothetical protein
LTPTNDPIAGALIITTVVDDRNACCTTSTGSGCNFANNWAARGWVQPLTSLAGDEARH